MKIGIISINAHTKVLNFASPLHTYAFQQFLFKNNIDNTIIDYKPIYYNNADVRHPLFDTVDHPLENKRLQDRKLKKWRILFYEREYRFDRFEEFLDKYYVNTDVCYDQESLDETDPGFDCYLCVTDVIWKWNPGYGFDRGYFLACKSMEGKKKIAYSASRGAKGYTREQEKEFLRYIGDFDYLSAREKSLQQYIKDAAGLDVPHILDPVFLHEKEFYYDIAIEPEETEPYILLYIVMERANELIRLTSEFAMEKGMRIVLMSENWDDADKIPEEVSHTYIYAMGIEEWLGYMKNASYVFTNSFHACCFSMIFHKQFFAGARSGDKIDSVLDMFNLTWRRISLEENGKAADMEDIDFTEADEIRHRGMEYSKDYILNAIEEVSKREHRPLIEDIDAFLEEWEEGRGKELARQEEEAALLAQKEEEEKKARIEAEKLAKKRAVPFHRRVKNKIKRMIKA